MKKNRTIFSIIIIIFLTFTFIYYDHYADRGLNSRIGVKKENLKVKTLVKGIDGVDTEIDLVEGEKKELLSILYGFKYKKNFSNAGFSVKDYSYDVMVVDKNSNRKLIFSFDLKGNMVFMLGDGNSHYLKINDNDKKKLNNFIEKLD